MSKKVTVPGVGEVEFPDEMSDQDVVKAIETDILPHAAPTAPVAATVPVPFIRDQAVARLAAQGTTAAQVKAAAAAPDAPMYTGPERLPRSDVGQSLYDATQTFGADTRGLLSAIKPGLSNVTQEGVDASIKELGFGAGHHFTVPPVTPGAAKAATDFGAGVTAAQTANMAQIRQAGANPESISGQVGSFAKNMVSDAPLFFLQPEAEAPAAITALVEKVGSPIAKTVVGAIAKEAGNVPMDILFGAIDDVLKSGHLPDNVKDVGMRALQAFTFRKVLGAIHSRLSAGEPAPKAAGIPPESPAAAETAVPPTAEPSAPAETPRAAPGPAVDVASEPVPAVTETPAPEPSAPTRTTRPSDEIFADIQANEKRRADALDKLEAAREESKKIETFKVRKSGTAPKGMVTEPGVEKSYMTQKDAAAWHDENVKPHSQEYSAALKEQDALYAEMEKSAIEEQHLEAAKNEQASAEPVASAAEPPASPAAPPSEPPPPDSPPPPLAEMPPEEPKGSRRTKKGPAGPEGYLPELGSSEHGAALRTLQTGEAGVRKLEAAHLSEDIRKAIPDKVQQDALGIMRDFKNEPPGRLQAILDGTDPAYKAAPESAQAKIQALRPEIEAALNPTPEMKSADARTSDYFTSKLAEGKKLGFLDSSIDPDAYLNHMLTPADSERGAGGVGGETALNRHTPFAKQRRMGTTLDAIMKGADPRTLNAPDLIDIYGRSHGIAAGTHIMMNAMKDSAIGKWVMSSEQIPAGWKDVAPQTRIFRNEVPFNDEEGVARVAHQRFVAPAQVVEALRPLTDPNGMLSVPGFKTVVRGQQYLKQAQLALSVFHIRALNVTAMNNMGPEGLVRAHLSDMASDTFRESETIAVRSGMKTSKVEQSLEAYRRLLPGKAPSRLDVIHNLPAVKQYLAATEAISHYTFDVLQRKAKVTDFATKDAAWMAKNLNATDGELWTARRAIARQVNAAYGGLNWEALGFNKTTKSLMQAGLLAPDWFWSNVETGKLAFKGGAGGSAAREFWARSAVYGMLLTQTASLLIGGKLSKNPTQVYMGKDKNGDEIHQNIFFAGAPSDAVNLIGNVQDYGALAGTVRTLGNKLSPLPRTGYQVLANRDFMGRAIVKKSDTQLEKNVASAKHIGIAMSPLPFSVQDMTKMLTDPNKQYTEKEFLTTVLAGTRPRHTPAP